MSLNTKSVNFEVMSTLISLQQIFGSGHIILRFIFGLILTTSIACQSRNSSDDTKQQTVEASTEDTSKATVDDVETGIRSYIKTQTDKGDGFFAIEDDSLELNLRLVRVHTEYLSVLSPGRYFACVDLADTTGDVYDVDFFLSGKPGDMDVTETKVHKLNGKPFYTWKQQKDETWK